MTTKHSMVRVSDLEQVRVDQIWFNAIGSQLDVKQIIDRRKICDTVAELSADRFWVILSDATITTTDVANSQNMLYFKPGFVGSYFKLTPISSVEILRSLRHRYDKLYSKDEITEALQLIDGPVYIKRDPSVNANDLTIISYKVAFVLPLHMFRLEDVLISPDNTFLLVDKLSENFKLL